MSCHRQADSCPKPRGWADRVCQQYPWQWEWRAGQKLLVQVLVADPGGDGDYWSDGPGRATGRAVAWPPAHGHLRGVGQVAVSCHGQSDRVGFLPAQGSALGHLQLAALCPGTGPGCLCAPEGLSGAKVSVHGEWPPGQLCGVCHGPGLSCGRPRPQWSSHKECEFATVIAKTIKAGLFTEHGQLT